MSTYLVHCVYYHTRLCDGSVFYVGKGSTNRPYSRSRRNQYWKNVVAKDGGFDVHILADNISEVEAYNFERIVIKSIKSQTDIRLTNLVDGGLGALNPSKETREKQRQAKLGKKLTEEHKEKIRQANYKRQYKRGYSKNLTDEQRRQISERVRKQVWTEERKVNISKAKMGHVVSKETRLKISLTKRANKMNKMGLVSQENRTI